MVAVVVVAIVVDVVDVVVMRVKTKKTERLKQQQHQQKKKRKWWRRHVRGGERALALPRDMIQRKKTPQKKKETTWSGQRGNNETEMHQG